MEQAVSFIAVMEKNKQSIKSQLSEAYDKQVQLNTKAVLSIIDSIQFLVKQGVSLRGSNWDNGSKREDGNFTSLIALLSKYSADLESHLHSSPKNARYLSSVPDVRNFMDSLKELTLFFKYSAKCKHILHDHLKASAEENFLADCVEDDLIPEVPRAPSAF